MDITRFVDSKGAWIATVTGVDVLDGTPVHFYFPDGSDCEGVADTPAFAFLANEVDRAEQQS